MSRENANAVDAYGNARALGDAFTTDTIPAKKLRKDDIIVEGRSRRVVKTVQVNPRECRHHTHVNGDWCYDNDAEVTIVTGW